MVKKKVKSVKKSKRRDGFLKEDVAVHTSLPPQVEGQLRCYLKLCVNQIVWMVPNSPDETHVRTQFWGEDSQGAIFKPLDVKKVTDKSEQTKSVVRTTARYPIRSGPKQFTAYLNDMGTLVLEVLSGTMQVPVGRSMVENITQLSPSRPINGFFPVLSADGDKVAELQVSVLLESLMASYDSTMSSIPTPDMSVDFYQNNVEIHPVNRPNVVATPAVPPQPVYSPHEDPFRSPVANKNVTYGIDKRVNGVHNPLRESVQSRGSNSNRATTDPSTSSTTRRSSTTPPPYPSSSTLHQYPSSSFSVSHQNNHEQLLNQHHQKVNHFAQLPTTLPVPAKSAGVPMPFHPMARNTHHLVSDSQGTLNGLSTLDTQIGSAKSSASKDHAPNDNSGRTTSSQPPSDLISELLTRGNRLKDAMIKSTLNLPNGRSSQDQTVDLGSYGSIFSPLKKDTSTGDLFKEILSDIKPGSKALMASQLLESYDGTLEEKAVDLVMGPEMTQQQYKMLKAMTGSPASSISGDDAAQSDLGDPLHDDSLIQDLFYNKDQSDNSEIDLELYTANSERDYPVQRMSRSDVFKASRQEQGNNIKKNQDQKGKKVKKSQGKSTSGDRSLRKVRSNGSLASLEDDGNMRSPSRGSRCSSVSSFLLETPSGTPKKKKKIKTRSRSTSVETKKKKKKGGGRRSRSRSRGGASQSDSELLWSETSRVSFDPAPSDNEEKNKLCKKTKKSVKSPGIDGLSIQRLTLLGRVHLARVVIEKVQLDDNFNITTTPVKSKARGKPPRPIVKKDKCTYFVEYNFPVVATSRDKFSSNAMATEVMRVASKKVKDGEVSFSHRSVFPVLFDADAIDKWWKSALIFKVYCRSPSQKVPRLLGMCSLSLKTILKSEALYLDKTLEVKDRSRGGSGSRSRDRSLNTSIRSQDDDWPVVGKLKMNVELASDSKDFSTMLAKTRLAEMNNPKIVPVTLQHRKPLLASTLEKDLRATDSGKVLATQTEPQTANISDLPYFVPPSPRSTAPSSNTRIGGPNGLPPSGPSTMVYQNTADFSQGAMESLTLHTLLMVPEGQNITLQGSASMKHGDRNPSQAPKPLSGWTGRDMTTRNLYLNCRMFWCDDVARSSVCWGTYEPEFNFVQVAPVLLTGSLLERMRNNYMVIEVWDKKTSSENDQLVGIVKLPLHQLYMSFRDKKIANSLLRSQYPVISMDGDLAIQNPFSGKSYGQLRVLLALGSMEQITNLQNVKMGYQTGTMVPERPIHYLERQDVYSEMGNSRPMHLLQEHVAEHQFEMSIENINGLRLLDNMIWGEADTFVQYHFPAQMQLKQQGVSDIAHATPSLKTFRTATTLCVPDPVFNDITRHRISLPEGTPVQRELLTACAGAGGGAGGIPFEVWCRYYHPNVRDQVIAKTTLPLARLCAMVTMQKRGEASTQTFSLPLKSLFASTEDQQEDGHSSRQDTGILEVTITYTSKILKLETDPSTGALTRHQPTSTVCISMGVVRASGLKSAALHLARHDAGMQYASEVGVNSYVRVKLSFLPKEDERITRTVARNFAPDFSYYLDFPCPLLWTEAGSDALSLAEILETAEATLELWHQVPGMSADLDKQYISTGSGEVSGRKMITMSGDVMIGSVTVPLVGLLTRKTGLNGWFPVYLPSVGWESGNQDEYTLSHGSRGLERVVGGLEVSLKFAHHEDVDKVIHAGRGVGWSPDFYIEDRDWESADELSDHQHQISVAVDVASFPLQNALHAGQSKLTDLAHCYIRYKFYDRGARCSRLCKLQQNDEDYLVADLNYTKQYAVPASSPFNWYLCEELLEVQVWVTYHAEEGTKQRPRNRDKLIGSAYIDISPLADTRKRQHRISNLYPLFKPGASSLGGAFIRAHMTVKANVAGGFSDSDENDPVHSPRNRRSNSSFLRSPRKRSPKSLNLDMDKCFAAHISIERAFHLPIITEGEESSPPNGYVSYQTAESAELTCTSIFPRSSNPVWNHEHETYLDRDLLTQSQRNLVFKVWHNIHDQLSNPNKGTDKVLGFVSVDLVPLTTGFQQVCGWYNIMDFNGSCQGQVKVSVTPQENVTSAAPVAAQTVQSETFSQFLQTTSQIGSHLPHFSQHYESVKKHHQQLTHKMQEMGVNDPNAASRSLLFNSLRANMEELDNINTKFKQRLAFSQSQPQMHMDNPHQEYSKPFSQTEPLLHNVELLNTHKTDYGTTLEATSDYYNSRNINVFDKEGGGFRTLDTDRSGNDGGFNTLELSDKDHLAPYQRAENDSSTYSQTLRNAQDTLSTAQHLIANLNQVSEHLQDQLGNQQPASEEISSTPTPSDATDNSDPLSAHMPSQGMHVHFSETKPTIHSGELPNTSHSVYTSSGILSEAINHREVFDRSNEQENDPYRQKWNAYEENNVESDADDPEGEVVMPKPLNDVSSANFANYASLHENQFKSGQAGHIHSAGVAQRGNNHSVIEEQDSWFSAQHNTSKQELYDTIDSGDNNGVGGNVNEILKKYGVDPGDYEENDDSDNGNRLQNGHASRNGDNMYSNKRDNDTMQGKKDSDLEVDDENGEDMSRSGKHVYAFQSLAEKYSRESDEEVDLSDILRHNKDFVDDDAQVLEEENPVRQKSVSRTSHNSSGGSTTTSSKKSTRKAAEFRHKYLHHRHTLGSSDTEEEEEHSQRTPRKKPSPSSTSSKKSSHRSEPPQYMQQQQDEPGSEMEEPINHFDPMMRTQKTMQIVWDGDKRVKQATGVDFDERSTPTYRSSQADSEQGEEEEQRSNGTIEEENDIGQSEDQFNPLSSQQSEQPLATTMEEELDQGTGGFPVYHSNDLDHSVGHVTDRSGNNLNGNNNGHVTQSDVSVLKSSAEASPRVGSSTVQHGTKLKKPVPNFFLPAQDLEVTMKALRLASTAARNNAQNEGNRNEERTAAKQEVLTNMAASIKPKTAPLSAKTRPKPSAEQAQRIAKIFQQKFG